MKVRAVLLGVLVKCPQVLFSQRINIGNSEVTIIYALIPVTVELKPTLFLILLLSNFQKCLKLWKSLNSKNYHQNIKGDHNYDFLVIIFIIIHCTLGCKPLTAFSHLC